MISRLILLKILKNRVILVFFVKCSDFPSKYFSLSVFFNINLTFFVCLFFFQISKPYIVYLYYLKKYFKIRDFVEQIINSHNLKYYTHERTKAVEILNNLLPIKLQYDANYMHESLGGLTLCFSG